jgi:D-alanyl-D-alanine carboxypeptidase
MGVSAAVILPGQTAWTGVSGVSYDTVRISPDMIFGIGSTTKNLTASLVLKLAEEGILSLDDSLHEWLPTYDNIDSTITIRQLLNHSSGISDYIFDNPDFYSMVLSDLKKYWTPEELLTNMVGAPLFSPGTDSRYSNTNYILLGMIIREATGARVSEELRSRFLDPLDLNNTFLPPEEAVIGIIAHPWMNKQDFSFIQDTAYLSLMWTSGAIFSTAKNIAQWARALFGGDVLDQAHIYQMVTFEPSFIPGAPSVVTGYGLGAMRFNILGKELWGHTGASRGYLSLVAYQPEDSITISVILNERNDSEQYQMVMKDFLSVLLGSVLKFVDPHIIYPQVLEVNENSSFVGTISLDTYFWVSDSISYFIIEGDTDNVFEINNETREIFADSSKMDFEKKKLFELWVRAVYKHETIEITDTAQIVIKLININDNSPVFNDTIFSIQENSPELTSVGTLSVDDPDGDILYYEISDGNINNTFSINKQQGLIRVANPDSLDHESIPEFNLLIVAKELFGPHSDTGLVTINVTDDPTYIASRTSGNNIKLYPNPARNNLYIEWPHDSSEIPSVEIISLTGKTLYRNENPFEEIDLSGFTSGLYIVKVRSEEKVLVLKVLIK